MIADYSGPANNPDLFRFMQGETITGSFKTDDSVVLVFASGYGFELKLSNGAFWVIPVNTMTDRYRAAQTRLQQALEALGGHK